MTRLSLWFVLLALCFASPLFAATVTVTSTDDTVVAGDAKVTLREAITAINAGNDLGDPDITAQTPGVFGTDDTISFNITGAGVHMIAASSALPVVNNEVFINGYSQPGSSANTNALDAGINAIVLIEYSGVPGTVALNIHGPGTTVRGLAIHGGRILIGASDVVVAGNFLGTDSTGTVALAPPGTVYCIQVGANTVVNNVRIGGPIPADRNLIVGPNIGVLLQFLPPGPGTGHVIQGNYIGTDITGTIALASTYSTGLEAISNTLISGNLISGNYGAIQLIDNTIVQGNFIGTQRDGVTPLGNRNGIEIHGGNSTIGGSGTGEANVIANQLSYGIDIYTAGTQGSSNVNTRNRISQNSIYANGRLGISVNYSSTPLPNDLGDGDSWAINHVGNDGQNYPVITSAAVSGGNATVAGTLNSIASSAFTIEFFANATCHATGYGEGQTFIGTASVNTDASGNASFGPLNFPVPNGQSVITSTATDATGNTSEFSQCLTAAGGASPTTTALTSSLNPSLAGQAVTFTATVNVTGSTGPTGSVQFKDGVANLGAAAALSGTTATLTTSALSVGTHPITAVYSGDASNTGSTSPTMSQVVNGTPPAATTTTLASSLNPSLLGQAVTFTATVNGANPTGNVQFRDQAATLGNAALSGGVASLTTSALTLGSHPIKAIYNGDATHSASTSPVLTQIVNAAGGGAAPPIATPTLSQWMALLLLGALGWIGVRRLARRTDS